MRVAIHAVIGAMVMIGSLSGCSEQKDGETSAPAADDSFACAALIGAADRLLSGGRIASDPTIAQGGLLAAMTYLNEYAIPKGLGEKQAFDAVNTERDRMLAELPASEIAARAKACIGRVAKN